MNLEDEFNLSIKAHLDTLTDKFAKELDEVIKNDKSVNSRIIFFEYDSPFFDEEFTVYMHYLDSNITAINTYEFLDGEIIIPESAQDEKYEEVCPGGRASEVLQEWLVEKA